MIASRIVEPLYVIEYLRSGIIPCFVYLPLHSVFLKQREEGLGNRVVALQTFPESDCFATDPESISSIEFVGDRNTGLDYEPVLMAYPKGSLSLGTDRGVSIHKQGTSGVRSGNEPKPSVAYITSCVGL
jgi:hypothetical protein